METDANRLPTWQWAFERGIAPVLSTGSLEYLERLLAEDSPQLVQHVVALPAQPELQDGPADAFCALGACGAAEGLETPRELCDFFQSVFAEAGRRLGDVLAPRDFISFYDDTPREEMVPALLAVVRGVLSGREDRSPTRGAAAVAAAG
jgi:hypothetical protein